ncbi:DUF2332 family protein [Rathayibacter tanaceti]|uniref:DUF2332 domain-containing protein n=1 Tax=Rathayibacter tanaceti TaxID=1671680 RepID=A0A168G714_9MICO|nr:hypothetical protein ACH61_01037 [Rathayibacter tanaceti]
MTSTAERYRRAAVELAQTSQRQVEWALAVAGDARLLDLIDGLPVQHRQPSLLFSVARLLGVPDVDGAGFAEWLRVEWARVAPVASERRTQTNEALRCTALVAALERITEPSEPVALVEIGASAGLCLVPERYSYAFEAAGGEVRLGAGAPLLRCTVTGGSAPHGFRSWPGGGASTCVRSTCARPVTVPGWRRCCHPTGRSAPRGCARRWRCCGRIHP